MSTESKIEKSIHIDAELDSVWRAWADPERLAAWFVDRAEGRLAEGETYTWVWEEFALTVEYEVTALEYHKRFSLRTTAPDGRLEVLTVRFQSDEGHSIVNLVHSGFGDDDETVCGVDSGWTLALELLREYVERHAGKESQTLWLSREAELTDPTLDRLYRTQVGLESWLTKEGGFPAGKGAPVDAKLRDGTSVTGSVLAHQGRESAICWDEVGGVLELKAGGGERPWVGIRLTTWHDPEAEEGGRVDLDPLRDEFSAALDRLVEQLSDAARVDPVEEATGD